METIKIGDHEFQWKAEWIGNGEYPDDPITTFYHGFEEVTYRKYWLFGPKLTKIQPKCAFVIGAHLNDPNYTNSQMRKFVMDKYEHWVEMQSRAQNIKEGKFI